MNNITYVIGALILYSSLAVSVWVGLYAAGALLFGAVVV